MAVVLVFAITTFLGAFLLFLVQPMVARMLLPALGGSPEVWNVCMVFFQAAQQQFEGKCESTWAILARDSSALGALWTDVRWNRLGEGPGNAPGGRYLWTDDYADVFSVLAAMQ